MRATELIKAVQPREAATVCDRLLSTGPRSPEPSTDDRRHRSRDLFKV